MPRLIAAFIAISTAITVGLFAYLGSFSTLMADDFCSIYFVQKLGVLRSVWYWYIHWHGGFSASFADTLLGLLGSEAIRYFPPLTIFVWMCTLIWAIRSLLNFLELRCNPLMSLELALLVMFGVLILSPATSASLIWWGGLRGYAPPLIIVTGYLALYIRFRTHQHKFAAYLIWYALSFGILFVSGGFSEPFTPLQIVIVFLLLLVEVYANRNAFSKPNAIFLLAGLLGGILALVIMVIAPGNATRQQFFPAPPAPLDILFIGWKSYLLFFARIADDHFRIMAVLAILGSGIILGTFFSASKFFNLKNLLIIFVLGLLFAFCSFLPAAYGQSSEPSDTSLITPVYVLIIMLCTLGIVGGGILKHTVPIKSAYTILPVLLILFSLGDSAMVSAQRLSREIGQARAYSESSEHRDLQIRRARQNGLQKIFVPAIPFWITMEPTDNPKFFVNQCMSLYYDIEIISSPDANE